MRLTVRKDCVLMRIGPLDGSTHIVDLEALWRRVLEMNHEPAASGHAGGQHIYETLRRGFVLAIDGCRCLQYGTTMLLMRQRSHRASKAGDPVYALPRSCVFGKRRIGRLAAAA